MRTLGVDPSSTLSGGAVVEKGKLKKTMIWKKSDKRSHPWNLLDWVQTCRQWCRDENPDMACVEALSVTRSAKTTRMIAFYQAGAVIACKLEGVTVIEARTVTARMLALGDGGLDKEAAYAMVKKMFPKHKFRQFKFGGGDETDAVVLGLAGPDAAES